MALNKCRINKERENSVDKVKHYSWLVGQGDLINYIYDIGKLKHFHGDLPANLLIHTTFGLHFIGSIVIWDRIYPKIYFNIKPGSRTGPSDYVPGREMWIWIETPNTNKKVISMKFICSVVLYFCNSRLDKL